MSSQQLRFDTDPEVIDGISESQPSGPCPVCAVVVERDGNQQCGCKIDSRHKFLCDVPESGPWEPIQFTDSWYFSTWKVHEPRAGLNKEVFFDRHCNSQRCGRCGVEVLKLAQHKGRLSVKVLSPHGAECSVFASNLNSATSTTSRNDSLQSALPSALSSTCCCPIGEDGTLYNIESSGQWVPIEFKDWESFSKWKCSGERSSLNAEVWRKPKNEYWCSRCTTPVFKVLKRRSNGEEKWVVSIMGPHGKACSQRQRAEQRTSASFLANPCNGTNDVTTNTDQASACDWGQNDVRNEPDKPVSGPCPFCTKERITSAADAVAAAAVSEDANLSSLRRGSRTQTSTRSASVTPPLAVVRGANNGGEFLHSVSARMAETEPEETPVGTTPSETATLLTDAQDTESQHTLPAEKAADCFPTVPKRKEGGSRSEGPVSVLDQAAKHQRLIPTPGGGESAKQVTRGVPPQAAATSAAAEAVYGLEVAEPATTETVASQEVERRHRMLLQSVLDNLKESVAKKDVAATLEGLLEFRFHVGLRRKASAAFDDIQQLIKLVPREKADEDPEVKLKVFETLRHLALEFGEAGGVCNAGTREPSVVVNHHILALQSEEEELLKNWEGKGQSWAREIFTVNRTLCAAQVVKVALKGHLGLAKTEKKGQIADAFGKLGGAATGDGATIGRLIGSCFEKAAGTANKLLYAALSTQVLYLEQCSAQVFQVRAGALSEERVYAMVADIDAILKDYIGRIGGFEASWMVPVQCLDFLLGVALRYPALASKVMQLLSTTPSLEKKRRFRFPSPGAKHGRRRLRVQLISTVAQIGAAGMADATGETKKMVRDTLNSLREWFESDKLAMERALVDIMTTEIMMMDSNLLQALQPPIAADMEWVQSAWLVLREVDLSKLELLPSSPADASLPAQGRVVQQAVKFPHEADKLVQRMGQRFGEPLKTRCSTLMARHLESARRGEIPQISLAILSRHDSDPHCWPDCEYWEALDARLQRGDSWSQSTVANKREAECELLSFPQSIDVDIDGDHVEKCIRQIHGSIAEFSRTTVISGNRNVAVIGLLGSGKSTLIDALYGCKMRVLSDDECKELKAGNGLIEADNAVCEIGHADESHTIVVKPVPVEHGLVLWDCPGFDGSEPTEAKIANAVNLTRLLRNAQRDGLIILLVVEVTQFQFQRGQLMKKTLDILRGLCEEQDRMQCMMESVCICLTKTWANNGSVMSLEVIKAKIRKEMEAMMTRDGAMMTAADLSMFLERAFIYDPLDRNKEGIDRATVLKRLCTMTTSKDNFFSPRLGDEELSFLERLANYSAAQTTQALSVGAFDTVRMHLEMFDSLTVVAHDRIPHLQMAVRQPIERAVNRWVGRVDKLKDSYTRGSRRELRTVLQRLEGAIALQRLVDHHVTSIQHAYDESVQALFCAEKAEQDNELFRISVDFRDMLEALKQSIAEDIRADPELFYEVRAFDTQWKDALQSICAFPLARKIQVLFRFLQVIECKTLERCENEKYLFPDKDSMLNLQSDCELLTKEMTTDFAAQCRRIIMRRLLGELESQAAKLVREDPSALCAVQLSHKELSSLATLGFDLQLIMSLEKILRDVTPELSESESGDEHLSCCEEVDSALSNVHSLATFAKAERVLVYFVQQVQDFDAHFRKQYLSTFGYQMEKIADLVSGKDCLKVTLRQSIQCVGLEQQMDQLCKSAPENATEIALRLSQALSMEQDLVAKLQRDLSKHLEDFRKRRHVLDEEVRAALNSLIIGCNCAIPKHWQILSDAPISNLQELAVAVGPVKAEVEKLLRALDQLADVDPVRHLQRDESVMCFLVELRFGARAEKCAKRLRAERKEFKNKEQREQYATVRTALLTGKSAHDAMQENMHEYKELWAELTQVSQQAGSAFRLLVDREKEADKMLALELENEARLQNEVLRAQFKENLENLTRRLDQSADDVVSSYLRVECEDHVEQSMQGLLDAKSQVQSLEPTRICTQLQGLQFEENLIVELIALCRESQEHPALRDTMCERLRQALTAVYEKAILHLSAEAARIVSEAVAEAHDDGSSHAKDVDEVQTKKISGMCERLRSALSKAPKDLVSSAISAFDAQKEKLLQIFRHKQIERWGNTIGHILSKGEFHLDRAKLRHALDELLRVGGKSGTRYQSCCTDTKTRLEGLFGIEEIQDLIKKQNFHTLVSRYSLLTELKEQIQHHFSLDLENFERSVLDQVEKLIKEADNEIRSKSAENKVFLSIRNLRNLVGSLNKLERTFEHIRERRLLDHMKKLAREWLEHTVAELSMSEDYENVARFLIKAVAVFAELNLITEVLHKIQTTLLQKLTAQRIDAVGGAVTGLKAPETEPCEGVSRIAVMVIDMFPQFFLHFISEYNNKASKVTFHGALEELAKEDPPRCSPPLPQNRNMELCYDAWLQVYTDHVRQIVDDISKYDKSEACRKIDKLAESLRVHVRKLSTSPAQVGEFLGHICGLWSYLHAQKQQSGITNKNFVKQPHGTQVLAVFRLLASELSNHLIQIKTGEGKSIALGFSAAAFAKLGLEVDVVCFNEYLSERDEAAFIDVFRELDVAQNVRYSDFSGLCSRLLEMPSHLPNVPKAFRACLQGKQARVGCTDSPHVRSGVLLMDEVDVFFSDQFFGHTSRKAISLEGDLSFEIISFVWKNRQTLRNDGESLKKLMDLPETEELIRKYPNLALGFLEKELREMLDDIQCFPPGKGAKPKLPTWCPHYRLDKLAGDIGYVDRINGCVSFHKHYGYLKAFTLLHHCETEDLKESQVSGKMRMHIGGGKILYSELPKHFEFCLGMSGTLDCLTEEQNKLLDEYSFNRKTFLGSTFLKKPIGRDETTVIDDEPEFYKSVVDQASKVLHQDRAILIFVKDDKHLDRMAKEFHKRGSELHSQFREPLLLHEKLTSQARESIIVKTTRSYAVTIATSSFGRGTDFVCRDESLARNGGLHIELTFPPADRSTLIQIFGRTCRQNDPGTARMTLLQLDVQQEFGKVIRAKDSEEINTRLHECMDKLLQQRCTDMREKEATKREEHSQTLQACSAVERGDIGEAAQLFLKL